MGCSSKNSSVSNSPSSGAVAQAENYAVEHGFTVVFQGPGTHTGHISSDCRGTCNCSWRASLSGWTFGGAKYFLGPNEDHVARQARKNMEWAVSGVIRR